MKTTSILLLCATSLLGQEAPPADSPTIPKLADANEEIVKLVAQEQWERGGDMFGGRSLSVAALAEIKTMDIWKNDADRRKKVSQLLATGKIQSARDYFFAALIFQHGDKSQDYLISHMLAETAAAKGQGASSKWLAAASIDRYLWSLQQPQVFGTQFKTLPGAPPTMEPFDRSALSDAMREVWCVISIAEQNQVLEDAQAGSLCGHLQ